MSQPRWKPYIASNISQYLREKIMRKKVLLVIGASGLAGSKIMRLAENRYETHGTYNIRTSDIPLRSLDITKQSNVKSLFSEIRPNIVVNTAALHNVDYCELHKDDAFNVNAKAVGVVADLCNQFDSRLIHLSTDFVFDGKKGYYSEDDLPNPQNVYAKSKLDGEIKARTSSSFTILRTSVIYGWSPLEKDHLYSSSGKPVNFALWAILKLKNGEILKIVDDQFTTPTLADVLADVILRVAAKDKNALYHVSGTSCISRYEFAKKIARVSGYTNEKIQAVGTKSIEQLAKRPMNSCLNCSRVQEELQFKLPDIDKSLEVLRSQLESECPSLIAN
jgi:dTDP-4-dehydrorhamnose reductase